MNQCYNLIPIGRGHPAEEQTIKILARCFAHLHKEMEKGAMVSTKAPLQRLISYTGVSHGLASFVSTWALKGEIPEVKIKRHKIKKEDTRFSYEQLVQLKNEIVRRNLSGQLSSSSHLIQWIRETMKIQIEKTLLNTIIKDKLCCEWRTIKRKESCRLSQRIKDWISIYLHQRLENRNQAEPLTEVFADETYINQNYLYSKSWFPKGHADECEVNAPTGRGRRLIIMHAGYEGGWVPDIFESWVPSQRKTKADDYHGNVDSQIYISWFSRLCQKLHSMNLRCLISIDNASYHKKRFDDEVRAKYFNGKTLRQATVPQLQAFLDSRKVQWRKATRVYKADLLALAQQHYELFDYKVQGIAKFWDHKVIFIPPYWPEFQAIEEIWGILKKYVGSHRKEFSMDEIESLVNEAIKHITPQTWQREIARVRRYEENFNFINTPANPQYPSTDDDECLEEEINFYDSPSVSDEEEGGNE